MQFICCTHPLSAYFFTNDVQQDDIIRTDPSGRKELVDSHNLGSDRSFGIYATSPINGLVVMLIRIKRRDLSLSQLWKFVSTG